MRLAAAAAFLSLSVAHASGLCAQSPAATAGGAAASDGAAQLLAQARAARVRVDSSLQSYETLARERFTLTLALRGIGRDRILIRDERAGNVQWSRARGLRIAVLGRRQLGTSPFGGGSGPANETAIPVPFYPGREPLWGLGSAFVNTSTNERQPINPLADGAEAYYRYALGDSMSIRLPDGSSVLLRELRATPRSGNWRVLAASLWFETATAQLVRAAYRYATPVDFLEQGAKAPDPANRPPLWVRLVATPLRGTLEAVTIESGLFEGRYWLPRQQISDFRVDAPSESVVRGRLEQRFQYASVNGTLDVAPPMPEATIALRNRSDSLWQVDSVMAAARDSLLTQTRSRRDTARAWAAYRAWEDSSWGPMRKQLQTLRTSQCAATGTYVRYRTRYGPRVPAEVAVPCDSVKLATADVFSGDLMAQNASVWGSADRAAMIAALAEATPLSLGAQPLRVVSGLEFFRFNRIEGVSMGGALRQDLGPGLRWEAQLRGSVADRQLNGEVFLDRTTAGSGWRLGAYRRLASADDHGLPFALGASMQNVFSGLDERFYLRSAGVELAGTRNRALGAGTLTWRLFAEHQSAARAEQEWVLSRLWDRDAGFSANIIDTLGGAQRGLFGGASLRWRTTRGDDASAWRLTSDSRGEAVTGEATFVRAATDVTLERRLPGHLRASVTGAIGSHAGTLPLQRVWNLGGWQTVRGYIAGTQRGPAFWMSRADLQYDGFRRFQPSVFLDQGQASRTADPFAGGRTLRAAGVGTAFFGGLFRWDAARALDGSGGWRINSYATARF